MANIGTAAVGLTLVGAGSGVTPNFLAIGTNSGLLAHGTVISQGTGAFVSVSPSTSGFVLTSNGVGADPSFKAAGLIWSVKSTNFNAAVNNGYFITGNAIATLPSAPSIGDTIAFFVQGAFTVTITGNTGQAIQLASNVSSAAGTQANTASGDACTLVYDSTNTQWNAVSFVGAWNKT